MVNKTWDHCLCQEAGILVGEETANIQGHPDVGIKAIMEMSQSNVSVRVGRCFKWACQGRQTTRHT